MNRTHSKAKYNRRRRQWKRLRGQVIRETAVAAVARLRVAEVEVMVEEAALAFAVLRDTRDMLRDRVQELATRLEARQAVLEMLVPYAPADAREQLGILLAETRVTPAQWVDDPTWKDRRDERLRNGGLAEAGAGTAD